MNRNFTKEETGMQNKHMKRCLVSLVIREMKTIITMRYCHSLMGKIKQYLKTKNKTDKKKPSPDNPKSWGCRELSYPADENANSVATLENSGYQFW